MVGEVEGWLITGVNGEQCPACRTFSRRLASQCRFHSSVKSVASSSRRWTESRKPMAPCPCLWTKQTTYW